MGWEILAANSETKIDTNLTNKVEKLAIYSIEKMYTNLSKLKCLPPHKRTTKSNKLADSYIHALRVTLQPLMKKHGIDNSINPLIHKLLFRDLSILYNFYECGFYVWCEYSPTPPTDCPEKVKEYFEKLKISLLIYFKTLLEEFNLMRFYKQTADIAGIKVNTDFNKISGNKIGKINYLLICIRNTLFYYGYKECFMGEDSYYLRKGCKNLPSLPYFISFYYWIKIINSLLKQYEQTMSNEELKQKINMKLYKYLSIVIISLCMEEAGLVAYRLIRCAYLSNTSVIKPINTNDVKKLLGKISKVLNDIYSIMICGEENAMFLKPFLMRPATCKYSHLEVELKEVMKYSFLVEINDIQRELKESLFEQKLPIDPKSKSGREDMCYILRTIGEIDSMREMINAVINRY